MADFKIEPAAATGAPCRRCRGDPDENAPSKREEKPRTAAAGPSFGPCPA